jgi:site-specific DNA-methyltransferase (adenine-specific)
MKGLAEWEPDERKRSEHILRNMLFGCGITQVHGDMTRRSVYVSRDASGLMSIVKFDDHAGNLPFIEAEHNYRVNKLGEAVGNCEICAAPVKLERGSTRENYAYAFIHGAYPTEEMKEMKFDVIVGNPPYQTGDGSTSESPLYQLFIERAISLNPKYLSMIVPSRWFTGGKGLDEFRTKMINDRRIKIIVDNPKIFDCFPGVKIRGGVNYFLWDRSYDGDCEFSTRIDGIITSTKKRDLRMGDGVIIRDNFADSIVQKVSPSKPGLSLVGMWSSQFPFGQSLTTNFQGAKSAPANGMIPIVFGTHVGYVSLDQIEKNKDWINRWKVILPMASSGDTQQDSTGRIIDVVLGEPIALAPGSVCTQTYLIGGVFDSATEAENYAYYLATKFTRFLVLQRKTTQHIKPDRFRFVPKLDMHKRWSDEVLYKHFKLNQNEIDYIESTIKPRTVNLSLDSPIPSSHLPGGTKYRPPGSRDESELGDDDE